MCSFSTIIHLSLRRFVSSGTTAAPPPHLHWICLHLNRNAGEFQGTVPLMWAIYEANYTNRIITMENTSSLCVCVYPSCGNITERSLSHTKTRDAWHIHTHRTSWQQKKSSRINPQLSADHNDHNNNKQWKMPDIKGNDMHLKWHRVWKKKKDKRRIVDAPTSSWSYLTSFSI